jgi:hypothetical protein
MDGLIGELDDVFALGTEQLWAAESFDAELEIYHELWQRSRSLRQRLEQVAGAAEPEPYRQARVVLHTLEALVGAAIYTWQPPVQYRELGQELAVLTRHVIDNMLPVLRQRVEEWPASQRKVLH